MMMMMGVVPTIVCSLGASAVVYVSTCVYVTKRVNQTDRYSPGGVVQSIEMMCVDNARNGHQETDEKSKCGRKDASNVNTTTPVRKIAQKKTSFLPITRPKPPNVSP